MRPVDARGAEESGLRWTVKGGGEGGEGQIHRLSMAKNRLWWRPQTRAGHGLRREDHRNSVDVLLHSQLQCEASRACPSRVSARNRHRYTLSIAISIFQNSA